MAKAARQEEMMKKTSVRASAAVEVGRSYQLGCLLLMSVKEYLSVKISFLCSTHVCEIFMKSGRCVLLGV